MQPMTVTEIASAVKGVWWNPSEQVPVVSAVSTDSRRIVPGSLFLPWVGEKFDGHLFIDAALDAGAAGCLCAKLPQNIREDKFYIKVADTRLALRDLASAYRDRFEIPFVQITGSVGKTTTKEMIAAVLGAKLNVLKTPENFNNDIGTPLTLLGLAPEHEAAVAQALAERFGTPPENNLAEQLESIAAQLVSEYWVEHKRDIHIRPTFSLTGQPPRMCRSCWDILM